MMKRLFAMMLVLVFVVMSFAGCGKTSAAPRYVSRTFADGVTDFSFSLYHAAQAGEENLLLSPLSVAMALGMAQSGAVGETRRQMEALFGISTEEMNAAALAYLDSLDAAETKPVLANSIWIDKTLDVKSSYRTLCHDFYRAEAERVSFASQADIDRINAWVREHTDGMIDSVLSRPDPDLLLCLLNAVCFEAKWIRAYAEEDVKEDVFHGAGGRDARVPMMKSYESRYLSLKDGTQGMIKEYDGGRFAFMAILPPEDAEFDRWLGALDGKTFRKLLASESEAHITAFLPEFSMESDLSLVDALKSLGMTDAFSDIAADFGGITDTPLYISNVIHKTHIEFDREGTKAAAITGVMVFGTAAPNERKIPYYTLRFDRPFVYAILDTETGIPVFLGTITTLKDAPIIEK